MSFLSPRYAPPGWYPDPSGLRQWREWTGSRWSGATRSCVAPVIAVAAVTDSLPLISALQRLRSYGIVAVFAGLGFLVGSLAHWPATAHPNPAWFAYIISDVGVALLVFGSMAFAFAAQSLQARWSIASLVPGLNVLLVEGLVLERLGAPSPRRRVVSEALLVTLFIVQSHAQAWLAIVPVLLAWNHLSATNALLERLSGPPSPPPTGSS